METARDQLNGCGYNSFLFLKKMAGSASEKEELYCICRKPYRMDQFMIECDICKDWFHGRFVTWVCMGCGLPLKDHL